MQVKVNTKQFKEVVKNCLTAKVLAITQQIKLTAKNNKLTINATDLEVFTSYEIPAEVQEEGIALVNHKKLTDLLKTIKEKEITIKTENDYLVVNHTKLKLDFDAEDNDFLLPESYPSDLAISINSKELLEGISKTIHASYKDKKNSYAFDKFKSICFSFADNKLDFVATDGHRLALYSTEINGKLEGKHIIPINAIKLLKNLLKPTTEKVEFAVSKDKAFFRLDNAIVQANLINGIFPDYRQVIPNNFNIEVRLDRYFFTSALQEFISIIELREKPILIEIDNNQMKIVNADSEEYSIERYLSLDKAYSPFKIKFNAEYFYEAIKPINDRNIIIKFVDKDTQAVIIPENPEERYIAVVMPMELKL